MSKPRLETQDDINVKNMVREFLQEDQYCSIHNLYEKMYYVDWYCEGKGGDTVWFAEFKRRTIDHNEFKEGILLSLHKYLRLQEYSRITRTPSEFVVLFNDGLFCHPITVHQTPKIQLMGRNDRGHEGDVEPCVLLPPETFKLISTYVSLNPVGFSPEIRMCDEQSK